MINLRSINELATAADTGDFIGFHGTTLSKVIMYLATVMHFLLKVIKIYLVLLHNLF